MNAAIEAARTALHTVVPAITEFGLRLQETALEIIAGPGGVLLLVLGILGMCVLAYDLFWLARRVVAGWLGRRMPVPTREARVRGLLRLGAAPAEIARAVGLPRDALALVAPVKGASRPKVPAAAHSAAPQPAPVASKEVVDGLQVATKEELASDRAKLPAGARPLPISAVRNANAPQFGEAA
jgi:hypothetical protein